MSTEKAVAVPTVKSVQINALYGDPENPNEMSEKQLQALVKNIQRYGFLIPVITNRNLVVADGHQRLEAAKRLGMTEVPVIALDIDEPDRLIIQQVMNKLRGEHRDDRDAIAFKKLLEAERLPDLAALLATRENRFVGVINRHDKLLLQGDLDAIPASSAWAVRHGDTFILGDHRITCGDSTMEATYARVMEGDKADVVFTDPPYGVSYKGTNNPNGRDWGVMMNDDLRGEKLFTFLRETFENLRENTKQKAALYCFYAALNHIEFEQALRATGWNVKQQIIWDKGNILGHSDYHWAHEPMMYAAKTGTNCEWLGDRTQTTMFSTMSFPELEKLTKEELLFILKEIQDGSTVWQEKRDSAKDYLHATQKPVALAIKALKNSSRHGEIVLEPFSGSGSTLLACEATGRRCRAIELNPQNVAIAITRWEQITGRTATRAQ